MQHDLADDLTRTAQDEFDPYLEIDAAIAAKQVQTIYNLAPHVARLSAVERADILTRIREAFKSKFHEKQWNDVIREAASAAAKLTNGDAPVADYVPDWRDALLRRPDTERARGAPHAVLANAIMALTHAPEWAGAVGYDEFAARLTIQRPLPWGEAAGAAWTDQHDRKLTDWLQRERIMVGTEVAGEAAQTVAMDRPYHPCRDYLRGLRWDGEARLDWWLRTYLGAEATEYVAAIGRRWLVSAVARILRPGCKADCVLVLEGLQGIGKSTAGQTLFEPWFCDHLPDLSSKDSFIQLSGMWCVELAELDAISRADSRQIKSFLSRNADRYRLPYGRRAIDVPRSTVFLGTCNDSSWGRDETGNRRMWPVRCARTDIDIAALRADRDQLWAEAVARYDEGCAWWVDTRSLRRLAEEQQAERYEGDAWDSEINDWARLKDTVSVPEILAECLKKDRDKWTHADNMRIAKSLKFAGWERYREGGRGLREWRYRRPTEEE